MGAPLSNFQDQVVGHLMSRGKAPNIARDVVLQAWSEGVGEVDASAEAIAEGLLHDHTRWAGERELHAAIQTVVNDQRAGDASMTHVEAIKHARDVLTVDTLNADDDTYAAYVKVLTADEEDLIYGVVSVAIDRAHRIFG